MSATTRTLATLALVGLVTGAPGSVAAGAGSVASVSGPVLWSQSLASEFGAGEADGVSIDVDEGVRLAPRVEEIADAGEPRIWSMAVAPDGSVAFGAGESGTVMLRTPSGETRELLSVAELAAQSLAWGPDGMLYAAMGPKGAIYRVAPTGVADAPAAWFTPEEDYVWAMVFDDRGNLILGTGGDGKILRVAPDATSEVLYDTPEPHVTALAFDPSIGIVAGTEGSAYVYRIDSEGSVSVLYDAPHREITGLLVDDDGSVWLSALGAESAEGGDAGAGGGDTAVATPTSRGGNGGAGKGAAYRVDPTGLVERVWASDSAGARGVARVGERIAVAADAPARLLPVDGGTGGLLVRLDAERIVAVEGGDSAVLATVNPGRLLRVVPEYRDRGTLVSAVRDTGTGSTWGELRWSAHAPEGTVVRLATRSGNTADPDDTWSDWSESYAEAAGARITSPPARFLQWRATLESRAGSATPALSRVEVSYVPRNLRPEITSFGVLPGGVVYRQNAGFDDGMPFTQVPPAIERQLREQGGDTGAGAAGRAIGGRPMFVAGLRTFTWEAADPNGDTLSFALYVRPEGAETWMAVAEGLDSGLFVLDTRRIPDGIWAARVEASDAPSRAPGSELLAERIGRAFVVDNTAPVIEGARAEATGDGIRITARAADATSMIAGVQVSLDGGEWRTVTPVDGAPDGAREQIDTRLAPVAPGDHVVMLRVTDTAQNVATARLAVRLTARSGDEG